MKRGFETNGGLLEKRKHPQMLILFPSGCGFLSQAATNHNWFAGFFRRFVSWRFRQAARELIPWLIAEVVGRRLWKFGMNNISCNEFKSK
ncbi:hypothetical protein [Microcoleus sp. herbarium12]|uniref:hypothetical protein n=1 Tax=Microcoleus sp. herbarium12 TaxID=3055437 RepID=UPI002FD6160A